MIESFDVKGNGVEQSFTVPLRPSGTGSLLVDVPITGLTAMASGSAIDLRDSRGTVRVSYSGLRVIDENGKVLAASMRAVSDGQVIQIRVSDIAARFPIVIDPTLSFVTELTATTGTSDGFGESVALSGTTAVVGAIGYNNNTGTAFVYSWASGTWTQVAQLSPSDGASGDQFGNSVAVSGTTAVIGAPYHTVNGKSDQGVAYVFSSSGGNWSQVAELIASDGAAGDEFGWSVTISGTTLIVGSPEHQVGYNVGEGTVYVFSFNGSSWS